MGRAMALFGSAPWGGAKKSNIIKYHLISFTKLISKIFNQTKCVFSHMKDIKYIRRDFHLAAWVMLQGWDLGVPWGGGGLGFNFLSEIRPDLVCELLT